MIKRILMIFLVQSIILIYYFNLDKLRNYVLTGRESSPKDPHIVTLDLVNTPDHVPGRLQCCSLGMGYVQWH